MKQGQVNSTLSRGYGTLAGLGIIGAAILAVPSTLLLDPLPSSESYLVTVAGLVTGLICMALPWERMDFRWLHVVGVVATVEAAAAVAVFGQSYTAFFFLIAVAVAYVTPEPKMLLAHLFVVGVALFGPVAWGPAGALENLQVALVAFPLLCLSTGTFSYLRRRMVADRNSYRVFADETLSLATRIAGHPLSAGPSVGGDDLDLPSWSRRLSVSARVSGAAACVLALPLVTAGLAEAGVRLPAFAADTLGSVGIELPNQEGSGDEAEAAIDSMHTPPRFTDDYELGSSRAPGSGAAARGDGRRRGTPGSGEEPDPKPESVAVTGGAEDPGATSASTPSPVGGSPDSSSGVSGGAGGGVGLGGALDDTLGDVGGALDDTLDGIGGLLGETKPDEEFDDGER
ncbi:MAG: hypothetical protein WKF62_04450 [Solirubrobacterales bacterium]